MKKIVDRKKLNFEGVLNYPGLYKIIDEFFYEKGYERHEKKNKEFTVPQGREVDLELIFWKKFTDYYESRIKIRLKIFNLETIKTGVQKGKLMMIVDGFMKTDYELVPKFEKNTGFFLLGRLYERFTFNKETKKFEKWIIEDVDHLFEVLEGYLNI